jgi:hypothetical protein
VTVFSTVPFAAYTISTPSWSIAASMALVLVPVTYAIRRQRTYP